MDVSKEEYSLLKELAAEFDYPRLDPIRHVTAKMLSEELGITHRAAVDKLEKMRADGRLDREKVRLPNGRAAWGYFRV